MSELSLDQMVELEERAARRAETEAAEGAPDGQPHSEVTLPWWQHPVNIITLVLTAAILAGMIGWMVGDSKATIRHNDVDTGFLQDMREHHEQAIYMSFVYRALDGTDPGLRNIAAGLVQGQSIEVGRMIQLLRDYGEEEAGDGQTSMLWMGMSAAGGQMPGMASEAELDALLASEGAQADALFVELMTAHHIGGIEMAEFAARDAQTAEVREMAAAMASTQRSEIVEMAGRLE